jgi:8-oxo-dGTP diphosphatase
MTRDQFPVVVHVLLWRQTQLFLLRRAQTGFMDGWYGLPGGHQQAGESVLDAAHRECEEESGVRATVLRPVCVLPYRSATHQGLNFVFEGREESGDWSGDARCAEPDLFDASGWYVPEAMPARTTPWITDVIALRARGEWFREYHWR